jgi:predicted DNA-binding transcriptional regulator AlpA
VTVASLISFSKSKVYKLMKDGDFPRPVKIGTAARWRAVDVQKWLHEHGGRDGEALTPLPDLERTLGNADNLAKAVVRLAGQVKAQMAQHDAQWARAEAQTLMLESILAALNIPGPQPVVTVKTQAVEAAGPEAVASIESRTPEADLRRASKHTMFPRKSLASPDLVSPGEAYRRAWEFFATRIGVPSEHALPYANHIHALTRILCRLPHPTQDEWGALERWFWRTSVSGVGGWSAGMMTSVAEAVAAPGSGQTSRLDVAMAAPASDLWIRQSFRQASGYAKTLTLALALLHPKDLFTGQVVDTSKALTWLHADGLQPVFSISFLKAKKVTGAKAWALANFIFLSPRSSEKVQDKRPSQYLARALDQHGDTARKWLASNLVDDAAIDAALIDDYDGFLAARSATIDEHMRKLAGWA